MKDERDLLTAVWKKALGYSTTECVEEFVEEDGQMVRSKQKVVTKEVAPDMTAAKLLMEFEVGELDRMTDEELAAEKQRLLKLLSESNRAAGEVGESVDKEEGFDKEESFVKDETSLLPKNNGF